jgi:IMP dehydrogenase
MEHEGSLLVSEFMTPFEKLVTAPENVGLEEAYELVAKAKKSKLPIISKDGRLVALVAQTDLKKRNDYPLATKSPNKSLRVAAAVGTHLSEQARVRALAVAGVDAFVIDQKQGDTSEQAEMIRWIKKEYPDVDVVGGNVVTRMQAKHLIDAGADGLRVGMGVGSVSRAQDVAACGRAQASAVFNTALVARAAGIPIIADGGIGSPGHIIKSLCMGASVAMCGSLLAGCEESPGDYFFSETGIRLKAIRGNQSLDTLNKAAAGKDQGRSKRSGAQIMVAQGVSGTVQDKGSMFSYLPYLIQSAKHGMQDIGMQSVAKLHDHLHSFKLRFELRSAAAQREGGIHSLHSFERKLYA